MLSEKSYGAILLSIFLLSFFTITAQHSNNGFVKIFDGKTLKGWKGDTDHWRIEKGNIVAEITASHPIKANTFLIWQGGQPGDFEFKAEFKISKNGNSGINYRSELVDGVPFGLKGYQADIDGQNEYTGQNYEERGRGFLAKRGESVVIENGKDPVVKSIIGNSDSLKKYIRPNGWNEIHIIAKGNHLLHYINGKLMSEVVDNDLSKRKFSGWLGLQAHAGMIMKVEYRNIYIKQ